MKIMEKIRNTWKEAAEAVSGKSEFHESPPGFRALTLSDLQREHLMPELIKTYQRVFGDGDIWREGAYCSAEGWENTISLGEYEERKNSTNLRCECGGLFQPCYPAEVMEARIIEELKSDRDSLLVVMEGGSESKITGFLWGTVAGFEDIEQRILNTRYPWRRDQGVIETNRLRSRLREKGYLDTLPFLYGDEMGVLKDRRGGVKPLLELIRFWTEFGDQHQTHKALFWTSVKSPMFAIAHAFGCEVVHQTRDGVSFFGTPDFRPVLSTLRHSSAGDIRRILAEVSKIIKAERSHGRKSAYGGEEKKK